jgi:hypothetical protein
MVLRRERIGTCSALVRMKSGSEIPRERNGGQLTLLVLLGDLQIGSKHLAVGDARKITSEMATGRLFTRAGCTLAVVGSADDGLFAVARSSAPP